MNGLAVPSVSLLRRAERLRVLVIALAGETPSPPTRRLSCLAVPLKTDQRPEFFLSSQNKNRNFFSWLTKKSSRLPKNFLSVPKFFSRGSVSFGEQDEKKLEQSSANLFSTST